MLSYFLHRSFKRFFDSCVVVSGAWSWSVGAWLSGHLFNEIFDKIDTCELPWHLAICVLYFLPLWDLSLYTLYTNLLSYGRCSELKVVHWNLALVYCVFDLVLWLMTAGA
jgi:hypothetical protein